MNNAEEFYRELEDLLNVPPQTIKGSEFLRDLNWDSMGAVMFIALADEKYGCAVKASLLNDGLTAEELFQILQSND